MNTERLLLLADIIEQKDHLQKLDSNADLSDSLTAAAFAERGSQLDGFNMNFYCASDVKGVEVGCGSAGCLAGHTVVLWGDVDKIESMLDGISFSKYAAVLLGLTEVEGVPLFMPGEDGLHGIRRRYYADTDAYIDWPDITPAQAADTLRKVAAGQAPFEAWAEVLGMTIVETDQNLDEKN